MTAIALALHIFGAVIRVGGVVAIYICLPRARHARAGALHAPELKKDSLRSLIAGSVTA